MSEISMRGAVGRSGRRVAKGAIHLQAAGRGQGPVTEENGQQSRRTLLPADTPQPFTCHLRSSSDPPRARLFSTRPGQLPPPSPPPSFMTNSSSLGAAMSPANGLHSQGRLVTDGPGGGQQAHSGRDMSSPSSLSAPGRTEPSTKRQALQPVGPSACSSTPSLRVLVVSSSPGASVSSSEKNRVTAPESYGLWEDETVGDLCQALSTVSGAFLEPRKQPTIAVNNIAVVGRDPATAPGIPPTATWWRCPQC